MAASLAEEILGKIRSLYPLRGKIVALRGTDITLNLGSRHGVCVGQRFKVLGFPMILEAAVVAGDRTVARTREGAGLLREGLRVEGL